MNIAILGTGYVGLVTGVGLAEVGNHVICVDIDEEKINKLKKGIMPIYEPGLEEILARNYRAGRLWFVSSLKEVDVPVQIYFIAVGTPNRHDGSVELTSVFKAAEAIGQHLTDYAVVVNKSTVPVGTGEQTAGIIQNELSLRKADIAFDIVSNPEFLREGLAVDDFMKPDRIVIGTKSVKAKKLMFELYSPFVMNNNKKILFMALRDSEMTKYAANAMLATKISFINEIANVCEIVGADVANVRLGIGYDQRIGFSFIYPGCGYGGSCFPKDVDGLIDLAKKNKFDAKVLQAVKMRNDEQKKILTKKIISKFGDNLKDIIIGVWGLAFKPETDDMREAPSIQFLTDVINMGAKIRAYDPESMEVARHVLPVKWFKEKRLELLDNQENVLEGAHVLVLITEWKQFRTLDFKLLKSKMRGNLIIDGRNQYDPGKVKENGFEYMGIGRLKGIVED